MTEEESKAWFEEMAMFSPKIDALNREEDFHFIMSTDWW